MNEKENQLNYVLLCKEHMFSYFSKEKCLIELCFAKFLTYKKAFNQRKIAKLERILKIGKISFTQEIIMAEKGKETIVQKINIMIL
jgi:hypothetical protein